MTDDAMEIGVDDVAVGVGEVPGAEAVTLPRAEYEALKAKGEQVADLHDPVHFAHENVANAEAHVERHRAFLAGAEEELARANADLERVLAEHAAAEPEGA